MVFLHKFSPLHEPIYFHSNDFQLKIILQCFLFSITSEIFLFSAWVFCVNNNKKKLKWIHFPFLPLKCPNKRVCLVKNSIKFHMLHRCEHPIFLSQGTCNVWCCRYFSSRGGGCWVRKLFYTEIMSNVFPLCKFSTWNAFINNMKT